MILLTGAAGKTGVSILKALALRKAKVKCLVRSDSQAEKVKSIGCSEVVLGDLNDQNSLAKAVQGVESIYFIAPNMYLNELETAKQIIRLAKETQVRRFVYHSVLHPHVEAMPHHWQKMRVEEILFTSGLDFTILQPCAYMQNILGGWKNILNGVYEVPYDLNARISMVDLQDVAEAAATVLCEPTHSHAIYELAGPTSPTQLQVADQISSAINRPVSARQQPLEEWKKKVTGAGMPAVQIELLIKMFNYYDQFGLLGNSNVLEFLLGRKPVTFANFLKRIPDTGDDQ